jgi:chromosome segregation ATPase
MRKNYQSIEKTQANTNVNKSHSYSLDLDKNDSYSYYSKVLKKPFDSIKELKEAEEAYYAELKAKENKAATKKADAQKVEEAFKALNAARREYKENLTALTEKYTKDLRTLKSAFESDKKAVHDMLAKYEEAYSTALKAFTEKYPEGYHLTLKDGDFETTISSTSTSNSSTKDTANNLVSLFDLLFNY